MLHRHIPHQHEKDQLQISAQVLHKSNLPAHAIDLAKEYQNSLRFKDILPLHYTKLITPISTSTKKNKV